MVGSAFVEGVSAEEGNGDFTVGDGVCGHLLAAGNWKWGATLESWKKICWTLV